MNCTQMCNLLLFDVLLLGALRSPNDVVGVLGHPATTSVEVRRAELMFHAIGIYSPAIRLATGKVDSVVHAKVYEGQSKVVERLLAQSLNHEYLALTFAYGASHRLILRLIGHEHTIINQGILAEEVTTLVYRLLEEG